MTELSILSFRSVDLPCLLKTITLVFFWLIFNFHLLVYFPNLCKLLFKPASVYEEINKSSAYIKQLMSFCCNIMKSDFPGKRTERIQKRFGKFEMLSDGLVFNRMNFQYSYFYMLILGLNPNLNLNLSLATFK